MKNKKGFTLVEIMTVFVIIGIISAIAIPRFMGSQNRARIGTCMADVNQMREALGLYEAEHGTYDLGTIADYDAFKAAIVDRNGEAYMSLPDTMNFDPASFSFASDGVTFTITVNAHDKDHTPVTGTPEKASY
jgi:type II secretion system protein G